MDWNDEDLEAYNEDMEAWVSAVLADALGEEKLSEADPGQDPEPESWTCPGLDTPAPALPPVRHRITDLSAFLLRSTEEEEGDE